MRDDVVAKVMYKSPQFIQRTTANPDFEMKFTFKNIHICNLNFGGGTAFTKSFDYTNINQENEFALDIFYR